MRFVPHFWSTHVGSTPHQNPVPLCQRLIETLDIPAWPQLPQRSFRENMYVQYSAALPAIVVDAELEKIWFDTNGDISSELETFYEHYLADDLDAFGLNSTHAEGFFVMLNILNGSTGDWIKGQVTGPISFGLTVTDHNLRASLYDDMLVDPIVKNCAMNARWQIRLLRERRPGVIIFVDEPYMASFGSAYISLSREQVIAMLNEVFEAIHQEGALAGVHCCANTDWSVLLATSVDIVNLDAYGYLDTLALYPAELRHYLDRGGVIAWGIVPNNEMIFQTTPDDLAHRLIEGLQLLTQKAAVRGVSLSVAELAIRSLISPSCGLGSTTEAVAIQVYRTIAEAGSILRTLV